MALYKYVSIERLDILQSGYIRFTQPLAFNDPFEFFPYYKSIAPREAVEEIINKYGYNDQNLEQMVFDSVQKRLQAFPRVYIPSSLVKDTVNKWISANQHMVPEMVFNFFEMKDEFREYCIDLIKDTFNNIYGILCLSEDPNNILMWSHYANNHNGFVIQFNDHHPFFSKCNSKNHLSSKIQKVRYSKIRPQITIYNPELSKEENMEVWAKNIFWVKNIDWLYEHEWRMVKVIRSWDGITKEATPPIYLYPLPINCIEAVIIGVRTDKNRIDKIFNLLQSDPKYSNIRVKKAFIDEKEYKLNIREFSP